MDEKAVSSLRAYALKALGAENYPRAHHQCRTPSCPTCGTVPLAVAVEAHTGSRKANFRGVIYGRCRQCGNETNIFRFTGPDRAPRQRQRLRCDCGHADFWIIICERLEGEEGLPWFFDEGVIAGRCAACGLERIVVAYD